MHEARKLLLKRKVMRRYDDVKMMLDDGIVYRHDRIWLVVYW